MMFLYRETQFPCGEIVRQRNDPAPCHSTLQKRPALTHARYTLAVKYASLKSNFPFSILFIWRRAVMTYIAATSCCRGCAK
jgi:hypothetical protein